MNLYYVYAHHTPDGRVFYVGKGCNGRQHQTGNRSVFWKRIVNKYGFRSFLLAKNLSEDEAYIQEIEWIDYYKRMGWCEANFTIGGDGVRVEKRWWNEAISKSLKGTARPKGKGSPSYRDVISEDELRDLYIGRGLSTIAIAERCGVSMTTVWTRLSACGIPIRRPGRNRKSIECINDGKVFQSMSEAARYYGVYRENVRKVLNGTYRHTGGKQFRYVTEHRGDSEGTRAGTVSVCPDQAGQG